jgi:uncharacterized protein (TIGR02266 family)
MHDTDDTPWANRRKFERSPLSILVQYRFETVEEFLAEYSLNISPGGVFIRTAQPRALGSVIYLQFLLNDGTRLIEGMGKVVRVNLAESLERAAGMGVEFVNFDRESLELIREICAKRSIARN